VCSKQSKVLARVVKVKKTSGNQRANDDGSKKPMKRARTHDAAPADGKAGIVNFTSGSSNNGNNDSEDPAPILLDLLGEHFCVLSVIHICC